MEMTEGMREVRLTRVSSPRITARARTHTHTRTHTSNEYGRTKVTSYNRTTIYRGDTVYYLRISPRMVQKGRNM
jgi:hypothetical protein